jgi:hypothetical protein
MKPKHEELKPCPFCGVTPEPFGDGLDRETKKTYKQLIHPINGCAISMLVFSLENWNRRADETKT